MLKNVLAEIVLLSIISCVLISGQDELPEEGSSQTYLNQLRTYFDQLLEYGKWEVNRKARKILPALATLPASVPDKSLETFKKFVTKLVEMTTNMLKEDNVKLKVKYQLFTPSNQYDAFNLKFTFDSFQNAPFDPDLETKVLIHGYRETLPMSSIYFDIKNKLLEEGSYNVIIVDWTHHSSNSFEPTARNAFFVGIQLAKFLFSLQNYHQISTQSIHIIAYGLGCHVGGMVGKMIPEIGRITGLDATGFLYDDLPSLLKLASTDAEFVDAIHTSSNSEASGIGTSNNYGDIDFFPNGGSLQPGCTYGNKYINKDKKITIIKERTDINICNHERALFLFMESISDCPFEAVNCESFGDFIGGNCPPRSSAIANMGFQAEKIDHEVEHPSYMLFTFERCSWLIELQFFVHKFFEEMVEKMDDNDNLMFNLSSAPAFKKSKAIKSSQHVVESPKTSTQPKPAGKIKGKFKKKEGSSPNKSSQGTRNTSGNFHFSSLFTSNPVSEPLVVQKQKSSSETLFSDKNFSDLDVHPHIVSCLKSRLEIEKLTKVQEQTIPILLGGQDALVKSCTGSGKTLSYAVPILHKLQEAEPTIKRADGVCALVIVPTRELAVQCYETFAVLTNAFTRIVAGCLTGGEKMKSEKSRLRKGINILVATPGRLLDHLDRTACLTLEHISWLVIDEADKLLEQSFKNDIAKIIEKCNPNRQSILLSATLSKEVENLAGITLSNPVHVDLSANNAKKDTEFQDLSVPSNLRQFLVVVPPKLRLAILSGFIIDNCLRGQCKAVIFFCSQNSVDFHHALLNDALAPFLLKKDYQCKFFKLHGNMKQEDRTQVCSSFKAAKEGVLLCTDVAARGLDLPSVNWIVQYTAPPSAEIYVHRVGRTARIGKKGSSLMFLLPSENKFSNLLAERKINFEELPSSQLLQATVLISDLLMLRGKETAEICATALQTRYEKVVSAEKILHQMARDAFASYIRSYASYPKDIRHILPFHSLHLGHLAKSFCLREAPSNLNCPLPGQWKSAHGRNRSESRSRPGTKNSNFESRNRSDSRSKVKNANFEPLSTSTSKKFNSGKIFSKPVKRSILDVSEFGSGLSDLQFSKKKKK
ncbi:hypothetical protein JTE90_017921 [Oedothorax gibbosus]|uniref:ATP-dependent RNA helicase n=1 Tax=Oedothorax gibbosus TaxID=931172 RepID=A0AAV6VHN8_9ARAC|nr:hypothetical protein JTE90_017921 [Oedothorax gibbosus]